MTTPCTPSPRFESLPELLIAGFNESYTFENRVRIPEQWTRFAPHIGRVPGQVGTMTYGVCWNYRPGSGFDYLTGVEVGDVSKLPAGFFQVKLPARRYAVFTHIDHVSKLPATFEFIWTTWLPTSGEKPAESPAFERYTDEFNPHTGMGGTEVLVPLNG